MSTEQDILDLVRSAAPGDILKVPATEAQAAGKAMFHIVAWLADYKNIAMDDPCYEGIVGRYWQICAVMM